MLSRVSPISSMRPQVLAIVFGILAGFGAMALDSEVGHVGGHDVAEFCSRRIDHLKQEREKYQHLESEFASDRHERAKQAIDDLVATQRAVRRGSPLLRRLMWVALAVVAVGGISALISSWRRARALRQLRLTRSTFRDFAYLIMPTLMASAALGAIAGTIVGKLFVPDIATESYAAMHVVDPKGLGITYQQLGTTALALAIVVAIPLCLLFQLALPKQHTSGADQSMGANALNIASLCAGALLVTTSTKYAWAYIDVAIPALVAVVLFTFVLSVVIRALRGPSELELRNRIWMSICAGLGLNEMARLPMYYDVMDELLLRSRGLFVMTLLQRGATCTAFASLLMTMMHVNGIEITAAHMTVAAMASAFAGIFVGRLSFGIILVFYALQANLLWDSESAAGLAASLILLLPLVIACDAFITLTLVASQNHDLETSFTLPEEMTDDGLKGLSEASESP